MKIPISYYGGKQQLASKIVSLFPEHKIYCEPFIGGAAVFFAKPQAHIADGCYLIWKIYGLCRPPEFSYRKLVVSLECRPEAPSACAGNL